MRGGFVRGGASWPPGPREEVEKRSLKKGRKTNANDVFSGIRALFPCSANWMEEGAENNVVQREAHVEKVPVAAEKNQMTQEKRTRFFADMVKSERKTGRGEEEVMEGDTNQEETEENEEMEEDDEVVIKKMSNGLYNLVIGERIKRDPRKE
ncbi:hypothetical protein S83_007881 [Arachis hypogaea]